MNDIRLLLDQDFGAMARIWAAAYPGARLVTEEDRERFAERALRLQTEDPTANFYGLFREGRLLGIMCLYDYVMNVTGARVPTGGVGQVAVDLVHKKEHVARDMMAFFVRHYRERGAPLTLLYPFRPDFYAKMGFGYGPKMSQYRLKPAAFRRGPSMAHVRYLGSDDKEAIRDCYNRFAARTHGMIEKNEREMRSLFRNQQNQIVGYEVDGRLQGYLVYTFEQTDQFITNDLRVQEWIYETPEALCELLTFLHVQADQIRDVIVETQDEDFYHLLLDPRNGSGRLIPSVYHESNAQGVGLMLRLVDVPAMFDLLAERDWGQSLSLKLTVDDSFLPENAGSTWLRFAGGRVTRLEEGTADVEVGLAIEHLSSLLAGVVSFRSLCDYGLATVSDPRYVSKIDRLFAVEQKPRCMTHF